MPTKKEEEQPYTSLDLGNYYKFADSFDTQSPYLGLVDQTIKPTEDPEYDKRLKRASKVNALGDVLSSMFDTAVSASGGLVDRNGENKYQLRNLELYNQERARLLSEKKNIEAAKLQEMMENIRTNLESKKLKGNAMLNAELAKSQAEWQSKERGRQEKSDAALKERQYSHEQSIQQQRNAADIYTADSYTRRQTASSTSANKPALVAQALSGNVLNIHKNQIPMLYSIISTNAAKANPSFLKRLKQYEMGMLKGVSEEQIISEAITDPGLSKILEDIVIKTAPGGVIGAGVPAQPDKQSAATGKTSLKGIF
jgi:hypothetical protein